MYVLQITTMNLYWITGAQVLLEAQAPKMYNCRYAAVPSIKLTPSSSQILV